MCKDGEEVVAILEFINNSVGKCPVFIDAHYMILPSFASHMVFVFPSFHYPRIFGTINYRDEA